MVSLDSHIKWINDSLRVSNNGESAYEKIMNDYLKLKEKSFNQNIKKENLESTKQIEEQITSEEYQHALDEIDKIDFSFDSNSAKSEKIEPLKEFWD